MKREDYDNESVAGELAAALYNASEQQTACNVAEALSNLHERGSMTGELPSRAQLAAFLRAFAEQIEHDDCEYYAK